MTGRAASWMRRVLGTIFAAWLVAIGTLFIFQRSLLFPRPPPLPVPADAAWIDVGDSRVPLLRRGPEGAPRVAWFHGNGGQLAGQEWLTDALAAHGVAMGRSLAAAIPGARFVERAGGHGNIFDAATFAAIAAMAKGEPG